VVGEHKHRRVEGRDVAPPTLPVEVVPGSPLGTELVAAHDLDADVPREVAREVVVEPAGAARVRSAGPVSRGEGPGAEVGREAEVRICRVTERRLEALADAGAEAVLRQHEVLDAYQLWHRAKYCHRRLASRRTR